MKQISKDKKIYFIRNLFFDNNTIQLMQNSKSYIKK